MGRLLLVEAGLLVGAGTATGLAIAVPLLRFAGRLLPDGLALFREAAIDWRIAAFGVTIFVLVTGQRQPVGRYLRPRICL